MLNSHTTVFSSADLLANICINGSSSWEEFMKKAKRKKSNTTKAIRSAKSAVRKTGTETQARRKEGSPRDGPGLNASVRMSRPLNRIPISD